MLKALKVLDRAAVFILAAIGLREPEFCRDLKRIHLDGAFESRDGLVVLLFFGVHQAEKVLCIGIGGIERGGFLKKFDGGLGLAGCFGEETEVVPDARILRVALGGFLENLLSIVEMLHVEKGDPHVDAADIGFLVENASALKFAEGVFEMLAVHEGDAVVIFADDLGARVFLFFERFGFGRFLASAVVSGPLRRLLLLLAEAGNGECENCEWREQECRRESVGGCGFWGRFHGIHISREKMKCKWRARAIVSRASA